MVPVNITVTIAVTCSRCTIMLHRPPRGCSGGGVRWRGSERGGGAEAAAAREAALAARLEQERVRAISTAPVM